MAELIDNGVLRRRERSPVFEYDVLDDVLAFGFADVDGDAGAC